MKKLFLVLSISLFSLSSFAEPVRAEAFDSLCGGGTAWFHDDYEVYCHAPIAKRGVASEARRLTLTPAQKVQLKQIISSKTGRVTP